MPTTSAKSGSPKKNNGGTLVAAGTSSGPISNVLSLAAINAKNRAYGVVVPLDTSTTYDPHGVTKAKSTGTFAYTPAPGTNYIMAGAGDNASKINNTTSSALTNTGGVGRKSINKTVSTYRVGAYSDAKFNLLAVPSSTAGPFPGRTKGTGAGNKINFVQKNGSTAAVDDAATPTRAVPGELTFLFGALKPLSTGYKAKDAAES